jgi:hypothetical protein
VKNITNKHRPFTLNQHDKIDVILKQARNDVGRARRIVARRSNADDSELKHLEDFWYRFEKLRGDLGIRMAIEHSREEIIAHTALRVDAIDAAS